MEGYAQGALRKELRVDPFVEPLKQRLWESLTDKSCHYLEIYTQALYFCWILVSYIVNNIQGALRKELLIASFVEVFKNANLGKSYW